MKNRITLPFIAICLTACASSPGPSQTQSNPQLQTSSSPTALVSSSPGTTPITTISATPVPTPTPSVDDGIPQVDIQGIGEFKIGMTEEELQQKFSSIPEVDVYSTAYFSSNNTIMLVKPRAYKSEYSETIFVEGDHCPQTKSYKLPKYTVAGIEMDLDLTFYKSKLIKIKTNKLDIEDAIELKYGPGKNENSSREHTCVNKLTGLQFTEESNSFTQSWKNRDIKAVSSLYSLVDSSCKKSTGYYFYVEKTPDTTEETKCDEQASDEAEKKIQGERKSELDDL